ncbi:hypothetical protein G9272_02250 [Streptomyces asoensis]|uniref:MmyB-like transcription regulator ligand binding domain-containing protein n=1 Tax=Streptomyces asoensis TaxID=249586 RepID=A0A6M4X444_9ACTN|nr:hypothetical protein [Streptomyces asoensis]QJT06591.1 hypothetical protein G9272_02250 [Streptomyces asoensis]
MRRRPGVGVVTGRVGELVTRSEEFRSAWARPDVRLHHTGRKSFHHPAVGVITLDFDAMELSAQPGLTLTASSNAPATPTHDSLRLVATWAATERPHLTGTDANEGHSRRRQR